jgi:DNA mismatch repair ATPase MutS
VATLAHDQPDWAFPTFHDDPKQPLRAAALGHPLLRPASCVRNDVSVGPPGTFLFVTGSNMSGKSTLLRAIGANAVLAAAGAPVCASELALPPVLVRTSMRIEDSLSEGISLFMAELLRIKAVVEAASSAQGSGRTVLYLLDEILHGTNTAERRIAARGVLRHLLATGAVGAVSSHDLTLADSDDLRAAARSVHFREDVHEGSGADSDAVLTFDYHLREGVATTRNALKLLGAVGLGDLALGALDE